MKKNLTLLTILTLSLSSFAQDTVRMMTYNLLNYPYVAASRADTLKIIIDDVLPDIFIVCELQNNTGANTILSNAMNASGRSNYSKAIFYNGTASDNMCFYDHDKFGLKSQKQIGTDLRDISEYVLYWKGNLPSTDSILFNVYSCHLKASSGAANEAQRFSEAQDLTARLDLRGSLENIFVGGDFNIYGSSEPAYTEITTGANINLYDPIGSPGEWHVDASYANLHTQATGSINGGSGGGLDDRFDFFFVSNDVMFGDNQVQYINGSYKAYGQDGNHYNQDINSWPANSEVSPAIESALYNMSDHLPVIMDVLVDPTLSIEVNIGRDWKFYHAPTTGDLKFKSSNTESNFSIVISDLLGKRISTSNFSRTDQAKISTQELRPGIYLATVRSGKMKHSIKFAISQ